MLAMALPPGLDSTRRVERVAKRVCPLAVFAAGRNSFEAVVRTDNPDTAKLFLFHDLPLEDHGWMIDGCFITRSGTSARGDPIWRLDKG